MKKTRTSPDTFLKSLPAGVRGDMTQLHSTLSAATRGLPQSVWKGTFWGGSEQQIIGYGDYAYTGSRGKSVSWFIVGLAAQKNYISVYVNAVDGRQYLAEKYKSKLGRVKVGKSNISFKRLEDLELDVLIGLVIRACAQMAKPNQPAS
jgi:hypothetical protein